MKSGLFCSEVFGKPLKAGIWCLETFNEVQGLRKDEGGIAAAVPRTEARHRRPRQESNGLVPPNRLRVCLNLSDCLMCHLGRQTVKSFNHSRLLSCAFHFQQSNIIATAIVTRNRVVRAYWFASLVCGQIALAKFHHSALLSSTCPPDLYQPQTCLLPPHLLPSR